MNAYLKHKPSTLELLIEYNAFNHISAKTWYVLESKSISRRAAIVAATDMKAKKQILIQCQSFWMDVSLFAFATRYIWFARIKVRGNVLIAPVRLMKSPRKGNRADTNVFKVR